MDRNYFVVESSIGGVCCTAEILSKLNFWSTISIDEILVRNVYSVYMRNKVIGLETVSDTMLKRKEDIEEDLKKFNMRKRNKIYCSDRLCICWNPRRFESFLPLWGNIAHYMKRKELTSPKLPSQEGIYNKK